MNIHPQIVLEQGYLIGVEHTDPEDPECQVQQNGIDLRINQYVSILPGESMNVEFVESFNCKGVFAPPVFARSSFTRQGVFVMSGVWDNGYEGPGGCTIFNMSGSRLVIQENTRIAQVIFFLSAFDSSEYDGHYNQTDLIHSKLIVD